MIEFSKHIIIAVLTFMMELPYESTKHKNGDRDDVINPKNERKTRSHQ